MVTLNRLAVFALLSLLAACANHDGVFEPACMALEGDKIVLHDGTFSWQRFTDQINIGDDGERIDPFPDFPKTGPYAVKQGRVFLYDDNGDTLTERKLLKHDGQQYLLTIEQHYAFESGTAIPACALRRISTDR